MSAQPDFVIPAAHPAHGNHVERPRVSPIDAVIDEAVALLAIKLPPQVTVERFPDRPADYDFEGREAAVLIIYDGSRFDPTGLKEELRLVATVLVRSLNGAHGAYALIHSVRTALHDQSLAGATGTRPTEIGLEAEAEGVFRWRLVFAASLPALPGRAPRLAVPRGFQTDRP